MTFRYFCALAAATLLPAGASSAQAVDDKVIEMDLQVTEWVDGMLGDGFDDVHRNLLKSAGYQIAVARNCDGFTIDNDKATKVLERVVEGHDEDDEDYETVQSAVLMSLGAFIATGQAVHALDEEGFCADAQEERDLKEAESDHVIWTAME